MNIYDYLIEGNENYGTDRDTICKSVFKCPKESIQEKVIIAPTWKVDIFKKHVEIIKQISGPTGHGYVVYDLVVNNTKITYISTGVGACKVLDAVLALGCTLCKEIIFIGSVGALDSKMEIGDIVIPEYSVCGVGTNRYLTDKCISDNDTFGEKFYPNHQIFKALDLITDHVLQKSDIKKHYGHTFSVDTIFAQYAHLNEIIGMGCNSIEMETATLFMAAEIAQIKSSAIFNVSDNTITKKSLYNGRTEDDASRRLHSKENIIPLIVLKAFGIDSI